MSAGILGVILVMAAATVVSRAAPFLFLGRVAQHPALRYVGRFVPPVILSLLVIYCLRDVALAMPPYGLPEGLALGLTVGLHLALRNGLVSIAAGTALYMVLVQSGALGALG